MQQYVEIKTNGELVNGALQLNQLAIKTLLDLIGDGSNPDLQTEYGFFRVLPTVFIRQDILYKQKDKICMHDAELSYFVIANDKTWDNLLSKTEQ